ncbi:transmembrane protein 115-like [Oppia nitens]|uniref:transmembrane protein 115-like n=1 Tax=Oppia nitens TaxID=1686743 RepID=UPI0023DBC5E6|nr:transmembrane protein 115-like [Oppia nitens]
MPANNTSTDASPQPTPSGSGHDRQPSVQLKIEAAGGPPSHPPSRRYLQIVLRNGRYFFSQISVVVNKLSPIVQIFVVVLVLLYLIQMSGDMVTDWLILYPQSVLSVGQWYRVLLSLFTHPFIELHFYILIVDIISISLLATLIEPLWGLKEVILFFWIVTISSAFMSCLHYFLIYVVTRDDTQLFATRIHGLSPFCASIAVTVKQMLSGSVLLTTAIGRLKNDDIPLTSLILAFVAYLLNLIEGEIVVMFFYGLIFSWIYLRFFQIHTRGSAATGNRHQSRGDTSDAFAFYTFFPNVLRPIVAVFADALYGLFVKCGLCPNVRTGDHYQTQRLLSERLTNDMNHQVINTNSLPVASGSGQQSLKVETL